MEQQSAKKRNFRILSGPAGEAFGTTPSLPSKVVPVSEARMTAGRSKSALISVSLIHVLYLFHGALRTFDILVSVEVQTDIVRHTLMALSQNWSTHRRACYENSPCKWRLALFREPDLTHLPKIVL